MRSDMAAFAVRGARSRDRQMGVRARQFKMPAPQIGAPHWATSSATNDREFPLIATAPGDPAAVSMNGMHADAAPRHAVGDERREWAGCAITPGSSAMDDAALRPDAKSPISGI